MRTLNRNKKVVYLARHVDMGEIDVYERPVRVRVNLVSTNQYTDIIAYGDKYMNKMRGVVDAKDDIFSVRDKVYVNTKPPAAYDKLARGADFIVESKSMGLDTDTIILTRTTEYRG